MHRFKSWGGWVLLCSQVNIFRYTYIALGFKSCAFKLDTKWNRPWVLNSSFIACSYLRRKLAKLAWLHRNLRSNKEHSLSLNTIVRKVLQRCWGYFIRRTLTYANLHVVQFIRMFGSTGQMVPAKNLNSERSGRPRSGSSMYSKRWWTCGRLSVSDSERQFSFKNCKKKMNRNACNDFN